MKSISRILVLFLLSVFVLSSCGKYEEGPMISLLPKMMRLTSQWQLDKLYIDDVEQTLSDDDKDDYIDLKDGGVYEIVTVSGSYSTTSTGTWELTSSKEQLVLKYDFGTITYNEEYDILRLTSKELWVERIVGNDMNEYHYIQR